MYVSACVSFYDEAIEYAHFLQPKPFMYCHLKIATDKSDQEKR